MNQPKLKYASGLFFNQPHENAPSFVLGSISIRPDQFVAWLKDQQVSDKGYVKLDVKMGLAKDDTPAKPYVEVNTYGLTNSTAQEGTSEPTEGKESDDTINPDDLEW